MRIILGEPVGSAADRDRNNVSVLVDLLLRWLAFEAYLNGLWDEQILESYLKQ